MDPNWHAFAFVFTSSIFILWRCILLHVGGSAPWLFPWHTLLVVVGRKSISFAARVIKEGLNGLFWAICPAITVLFIIQVFLEGKDQAKGWPLTSLFIHQHASGTDPVTLLFKVVVKRSIGIMADPPWHSPWLHGRDFPLFSFALSVSIAALIQRDTGPALPQMPVRVFDQGRRVRACLRPFQRADSLLRRLVFKWQTTLQIQVWLNALVQRAVNRNMYLKSHHCVCSSLKPLVSILRLKLK